MALPLNLSDWTLDLVRRLADDFEPGAFDFKEHLKGKDPNHNDRIREAAAAMANTDGGFLIFGVIDRKNRKPGDDPVPGIPLTGKEELRQDFGHIVEGLKRGIWFDSSPKPILVDPAGTRGVFVVHIPRSPLRPHEFKGRFPKRAEGGNCVEMDFYEVREQMLNTEERLSKLTLLRIHLEQLKAVSEQMRMGEVVDKMRRSDRFDASSINLLVAETCNLFPPGNGLLRDLSVLVTQAHSCNSLLDKLNQLAATKPYMTPAGQQWLTEMDQLSFSVGTYCRKTEEALAAVYGKVQP